MSGSSKLTHGIGPDYVPSMSRHPFGIRLLLSSREALRGILAGLFCAILAGCSGDKGSGGPVGPPTSTPPAAFSLVAPKEVVSGKAFSLTISALSSSGQPSTGWQGAVTLAASGGSISPATAQLSNGTATVQATLSDVSGEITISATAGSARGTATTTALTGAPAVRLEIVPGALLLTADNQTAMLSVRAFDAAGKQTVPGPLTWQSSTPSVVAISSDGLATAPGGVGSSQISVTTGSVISAPILAVVVKPTPGAVLVADSQVVSAISPVDPNAAYIPGWQYTVRLKGVSPTVGQVLVASGQAPIAGRVVAVSSSGTESNVTLALLPLKDLFQEFSLNQTIQLEQVPLAISPQVLSAFRVEPMRSGWVRFTSRPGALSPGRGPSGSAATEFTAGPFTCKSPVIPQVSPSLTSISVTVRPSLSVDFRGSVFRGVERIVVRGGIEGDVKVTASVAAISDSIGCKAELGALYLPVGGALAFFVSGKIPVGVGFGLGGKVELPVGFEAGVNTSAQVQLGFDCTGGCHAVAQADATAAGSFKPALPSGLDLRYSIYGRAYVYAEVRIGNPIIKALQFEAFELEAGLKQELILASRHTQASDPEYASSYELKGEVEGGTSSGVALLRNLLDITFAELRVSLPPKVYARSARGTFEIAPANVRAGDATQPGETATFTVALDPVSYLGAYAIDAVEIYWKKPDGSGGFTLEPGPGDCASIAPSTSGQTLFRCQAQFPTSQIGRQTFVAFVKTHMLGEAMPALEVADDGSASVTVGTVVAPPARDTIRAVVAGGEYACMLKATGQAYCWGDNSLGQLGTGSTGGASATPVAVSGSHRFVEISAGDWHACGLTAGGEAFCWGYNIDGQLGNGTTDNTPTPLPVAGGHSFVHIGAGERHTCGVTSSGVGFCWGYNGDGELGTGVADGPASPSIIKHPVPLQVSGGVAFQDIRAGYVHTCGIALDGKAYCWGGPFNGALGDGLPVDVPSRPLPSPVFGNRSYLAISPGGTVTCAVTSGQQVYCWGQNTSAQLGIGSYDQDAHATPLLTGSSFTAVSAGIDATCGVRTDSRVYCWGSNYQGQLGVLQSPDTCNGTPCAVRPNLVGLSVSVRSVAVSTSHGGTHACAVTVDEEIYCWGAGIHGELGNGQFSNSGVPVKVRIPSEQALRARRQ